MRAATPELLAEMMTTVPIGQGAGYGLGLLVLETPCGRLIGHDGGIPGFITIVLSTEDGRRQFGVMVNQFFTTPALDQAYSQVVVQIAMRLLEGAPCDPAASGASLGAAVRAGELARTQQTPGPGSCGCLTSSDAASELLTSQEGPVGRR